mmetsp:Transcript_24589/g.73483  ORF Transcript_24589/g.73483 Transcript_24589/m.73483 type:complete len:376 (-) Transcript_24589:491-1618(-)
MCRRAGRRRAHVRTAGGSVTSGVRYRNARHLPQRARLVRLGTPPRGGDVAGRRIERRASGQRSWRTRPPLRKSGHTRWPGCAPWRHTRPVCLVRQVRLHRPALGEAERRGGLPPVSVHPQLHHVRVGLGLLREQEGHDRVSRHHLAHLWRGRAANPRPNRHIRVEAPHTAGRLGKIVARRLGHVSSESLRLLVRLLAAGLPVLLCRLGEHRRELEALDVPGHLGHAVGRGRRRLRIGQWLRPAEPFLLCSELIVPRLELGELFVAQLLAGVRLCLKLCHASSLRLGGRARPAEVTMLCGGLAGFASLLYSTQRGRRLATLLARLHCGPGGGLAACCLATRPVRQTHRSAVRRTLCCIRRAIVPRRLCLGGNIVLV